MEKNIKNSSADHSTPNMDKSTPSTSGSVVPRRQDGSSSSRSRVRVPPPPPTAGKPYKFHAARKHVGPLPFHPKRLYPPPKYPKTPPPPKPENPRTSKSVSKFNDKMKRIVVSFIKSLPASDKHKEPDNDGWIPHFINEALPKGTTIDYWDVKVWIDTFPKVFNAKALIKLQRRFHR